MTKKTKLVPFDYQKAKLGAKLIYRNGNYPTEVLFPWTAGLNTLCVVSVYLGQCHTHFSDGFCNIHKSECDVDLLIIEELEEKTFYVNVYPEGFLPNIYASEEEAKTYRNGHSFGTLKVTYTDEDLIR